MTQTCERCPNKKSKLGCPAWIGAEAGIIETNVATGEERQMEGCFYQVIPRLMTHVIAASNRPAAAFEGLRNVLQGASIAGQYEMALQQHKLLEGKPHHE